MFDFISLNLNCPVCGESLMDREQLVDNEPSIKLEIETGSNKGIIRLSSIYGSYNYTSEVEILPDAVVKFYCTHCRSQITSSRQCDTCGAPMIPFYLDMGGKVAICSRSGCKNHFVEFEDLSLALRKLYQEYSFQGGSLPGEAPDATKGK